MEEVVIAIFEDEASAEPGLVAVRELHLENAIEVHGVGVAAKDEHGKLTLKDAVGKGAPSALAGAAIGGLIGLLAGPAGAIAGAAGGAFIGTWRDLTHLGIDAEVVEQVGAALEPGKSAVIAAVTENAGVLEARMRELGAQVFRAPMEEFAARTEALEAQRAEAAKRGETLPGDDERQAHVKGRPARSAHP